jgi:hypothetical protein
MVLAYSFPTNDSYANLNAAVRFLYEQMLMKGTKLPAALLSPSAISTKNLSNYDRSNPQTPSSTGAIRKIDRPICKNKNPD